MPANTEPRADGRPSVIHTLADGTTRPGAGDDSRQAAFDRFNALPDERGDPWERIDLGFRLLTARDAAEANAAFAAARTET